MEAGEELLLLLQLLQLLQLLLLQYLLPHLHQLLRPQVEREGNCPRPRSTSPVQGRSDSLQGSWRRTPFSGSAGARTRIRLLQSFLGLDPSSLVEVNQAIK